MTDQPINGADGPVPETPIIHAMRIFGDRLIGSMKRGTNLNVDIPQLVIRTAVNQIALDCLLEHYCATQGITEADFQAALAERLLERAAKLPQPGRVDVAVAAAIPRRR